MPRPPPRTGGYPAGGGEEVCVSRPGWECQTGRAEQLVEGFAGDNKEFEVDTLGDGEPAEVRRRG